FVSRWIARARRTDLDGRASESKSHGRAVSLLLVHHVGQHVADKTGNAGIKICRTHSRPPGGVFGERNRDILHYTNLVLHGFRVNHGERSTGPPVAPEPPLLRRGWLTGTTTPSGIFDGYPGISLEHQA